MFALDLLAKKDVSTSTLSAFGVGVDSLPPHPSAAEYQALLDSDRAISLAAGTSSPDRLFLALKDQYGDFFGFSFRSKGTHYHFGNILLASKSDNLYGLYEARQSIMQNGYAILVEGFFDVLLLHDRGITNVVSAYGTNFTKGQLCALARYTDTVIIANDPDTGGTSSEVRTRKMLELAGLTAYSLTLPEGEDPDDFVRSRGSEEFLSLCLTAIEQQNRNAFVADLKK